MMFIDRARRFVLVIQGGNKTLLVEEQTHSLYLAFFLRQPLRKAISPELKHQQTHQKYPNCLEFVLFAKAPKKLLKVLKMLQHMKTATKFSIRHTCAMLELAQS